jgi:O-antigen ligase
VETGIFGFLLFVGFWIVVIRAFWKFLKEHKDIESFLVYFVAQALLMVLWVLGASVFDITLFNDKVLMFFFLDIGLAGLIIKRYHEFENHL